MTRASLLFLPWLLATQAGCTVTAVGAKEDARPKNSCSSSESCGKGESCFAGLCQSLNGELEAVLLTATPDFESRTPRLTFVKHLDELPAPDGVSKIVWPGPATVTGSLVLPEGHCYPEFVSDDPSRAILASTDGTLPLTATLSLRQRLLGLPQQTYYAKTVTAPLNGYTFDIQVPGGEYDVYLVPPKRQRGTCVVPPQLFRGVPIGVDENSDPNGAYRFNLAAVSELDLHVLWPVTSPSLDGWTADLIDPLGGNRISTEVVLGNPTPGRLGRLDYAVPLAYSAVTEQAGTTNVSSADDLLRLRPPLGAVAPTIYLARSALGLLQEPTDSVYLTTFTQIPRPVSVRGQMVKKADGRTAPGTLTLVSTKIYGVDLGVPASFQTTVSVRSNGVFDVVLPPGRYAVQAIPAITADGVESNLSTVEAEWDVPADAPQQFGKLLELPPASLVTGQSRVSGAQAHAQPVPTTLLPFEEVFGEQPFVPRATGALVDDAGRFELRVDQVRESRVNVSVRAPEELGFGWFVRPGLGVELPTQDLGRVNLPLPSILSGQASVQEASRETPLSSAVIRAYAYLDESFRYTRDPSVAKTVVQVAETRAFADGSFRLLLPATIDAPK